MHAAATRTSTGAYELMKLEVCGNRIINFADFFRHRVEIRQKKGYHSSTGRQQPLSVWAGTRLSRVGFLLFHMLPEYDNTYVKRII